MDPTTSAVEPYFGVGKWNFSSLSPVKSDGTVVYPASSIFFNRNAGFTHSFKSEHASTTMQSETEFNEGVAAFAHLGNSRKREIRLEAQEKFLEIARGEYFEYGYTPPSERYLHELAKETPGLLGDVVQGIFLSSASDSTVMVALLNAIGSLPYDHVRPFGQVTAIAAITSPSVEVKEAAIRVYETWGHPEGARVLQKVDCPWPWLDDYRKQVIEDLSVA